MKQIFISRFFLQFHKTSLLYNVDSNLNNELYSLLENNINYFINIIFTSLTDYTYSSLTNETIKFNKL
jgi:hypothetical protein